MHFQWFFFISVGWSLSSLSLSILFNNIIIFGAAAAVNVFSSSSSIDHMIIGFSFYMRTLKIRGSAHALISGASAPSALIALADAATTTRHNNNNNIDNLIVIMCREFPKIKKKSHQVKNVAATTTTRRLFCNLLWRSRALSVMCRA